MATSWEIKGPSFSNCNCAYGCPCQFNALPTHGDCRAFMAIRIDEGHYGDLELAGVTFAWLLAWPGAVHEGNGTQQLIVHESATPEQRDAVQAIVRGDDCETGANFFQVFNSTMTTTLETLSRPVEFECDIAERTARVRVPDLVEATGEPIRNPVTGDTHRAQVTLPNGMEYHTAEYASGATKATGEIVHDFSGTHAHFYNLHITRSGAVHP